MIRYALLLAFLFIPGLAPAAEVEAPAVNVDPTATGGLSEVILKYIVVPLLPIFGAALVAAFGFLANLLRIKTEQLRFGAALGAAADLVDAIVRDLEVTMRPTLAKAFADGRLTPEEGALIKAEALKQVTSKLPAEMLKLLEGTLGAAVQTWLSGQVERAHAALEQTSVPAGLASPPLPA